MTTINVMPVSATASTLEEFIKAAGYQANGRADQFATKCSEFDSVFSHYGYDATTGLLTVQRGDKTEVITSFDAFLHRRKDQLDNLGNGFASDRIRHVSLADVKQSKADTPAAPVETVVYLQSSAGYLETALAEHGNLIEAYKVLADLPAAPKLADYKKAVDEALALMLPEEQKRTYKRIVADEAGIKPLVELGFTFGPKSCWETETGLMFRGEIGSLSYGASIAKIKELIKAGKVEYKADPTDPTLPPIMVIEFTLLTTERENNG